MSLIGEIEAIVLENIDDRYYWIARDENGLLNVFLEKPEKREYDPKGYFAEAMKVELTGNWEPPRERRVTVGWNKILGAHLPMTYLFDFIKWDDEEPCNIDDLLYEYYQHHNTK